MKKVLFVLFMVTLGHKTIAQSQQLEFEVFRNEKRVGSLSLSKEGNTHKYKIKSSFKISLDFIVNTVQIQGSEVSNFEDGILQTSIVHRKVNGKEKVNKQTIKTASGYQLSSEGDSGRVLPIQEIKSNLQTIFYWEPVNNQQLFSDNQQVLLRTIQKSIHSYEIIFPNGDFNLYRYSNGKCIWVEHHTKWATLVLRRIQDKE